MGIPVLQISSVFLFIYSLSYSMSSNHLISTKEYLMEASELATISNASQGSYYEVIVAIGKIGLKEAEYTLKESKNSYSPGEYDAWKKYCDDLAHHIRYNPKSESLMVVPHFVFHIEPTYGT